MSPCTVPWWKRGRLFASLLLVALMIGLVSMGVWAAVNSVNIDSPTQASPVYVKPGQSFTVQYDADGDEVVTIQVWVGGNLQFSESNLLPITDRPISVPAPSGEGKHNLEVRAIGSTTKSDTEVQAVWVDGTAPTVSITPIPDCIANPSIAGTASDTLSGVQLVSVKIKNTTDNTWWNGTTWVTTDPGWLPATGTISWSYSGVTWVDAKSYTVYAKAQDKAGNESSGADAASFTVDTTRPTVAITNPPSGWVKSLAALSGTASDTGGCGGLASVQVQVYNITGNRYWNGTNWVSTPAWNNATIVGTNWSYAMPLLTSGRQYQVKAKAMDGAGNSQETAAATFWYDDEEPTVTIAVPEDEAYYKDVPDAFSGTASDAHSGVQKVELALQRDSNDLYWDGGEWVEELTWLEANGTNSWTWDASGVSWDDGEAYVLTVKATDNAGNDPTAQVTFYYDITSPTVTIDDIPATIGCALQEISGTAEDDFAGVDKVFVQINSGGWQEANFDSDTGEWTFDVSEFPFADHTNYTVQVKAVDKAGNESTIASDSFLYDACPVVAITSPANGAFVGTEVTVQGTSADGAGAVVEVWVQLDAGSWVLATDTSAGGDWSTWKHTFSGLAVGNHTIRAKAVDDFGQESVVQITVKVPSGLTVTVSPIDDNTQPTGFSGTATGDVAQVKITIQGPSGYWDGSAWSASAAWLLAAGTTSWSYDATLVPFLGGETYTVTAKAFDALGNPSDPAWDSFIYGSSADIDLGAGWNLISLPLIPNDENIANVLAGLPVVRVSQWTPGVGEQRWEPDPSPIKQFTTMTTGRGYWVRMSSAATLVNKGLFQPKPPAAPKSYSLSAGWNLIGYHATSQVYLDTPKTVQQYLGAVANSVQAMYYYEGGMYKIPAPSDLMKVGFGYWVALTQAGTIYP